MTYTILFIHAHLSPLELSNFITVFSVRSNWNFGRTLRAIRLPILRQLQVNEAAFIKKSAIFGLDRDWEELSSHKQASASFQKLLILPWKYNFARKVRKCSNRDAVTYAVVIGVYLTLPIRSGSRQILVSNISFSCFFFQKTFGYVYGHRLTKEYNKNSSRIKEVTELSY